MVAVVSTLVALAIPMISAVKKGVHIITTIPLVIK